MVLLAARSTVEMLKCNMCGLLALTFSKYVANAGYCDPKLHGFCLKWRYMQIMVSSKIWRRRAGGDHARSPWHVAAFRTGASSAHERRCPGRVRSACELRVMGVQPARRAQRSAEAIRLGWSAPCKCEAVRSPDTRTTHPAPASAPARTSGV